MPAVNRVGLACLHHGDQHVAQPDEFLQDLSGDNADHMQTLPFLRLYHSQGLLQVVGQFQFATFIITKPKLG